MILVEVSPDSTIYELKEKIDEKEGINPEEQTFIFEGKGLEDQRTVSSNYFKFFFIFSNLI